MARVCCVEMLNNIMEAITVKLRTTGENSNESERHSCIIVYQMSLFVSRSFHFSRINKIFCLTHDFVKYVMQMLIFYLKCQPSNFVSFGFSLSEV